jgi:hypothetical protein
MHMGEPEGIIVDANGNPQAQPDPIARVGRDLGRFLRRIIKW